MRNTQDLKIVIKARNEASRELKRLSKDLKTQMADFAKWGAAIGIAGGFVTSKLIGVASSSEETQSKFNTVFRGMERDMNAWSESFAQDVGRADKEIKTFAAGIADVLKPMGLQTDAAAELSKEMIQLALDVASFNDRQDADVIHSMTSALTGERESLKTLGIVIMETDVKTKMLEQAAAGLTYETEKEAKAQATVALMLDATKDAQGDLARTSKSYANQVKAMSAEMTNLSETIGKMLLPAATKMVRSLKEMIVLVKEDMKDGFSETTTNAVADMKDIAWTITSTVGESVKGIIILMETLHLRTAAWKALFEPAIMAAKSFTTGIKSVKAGISATGDVLGGVIGEAFAPEGMVGHSSLQGLVDAKQTMSDLADEIFYATKEGRKLAYGIGEVKKASEEAAEAAKEAAAPLFSSGSGVGKSAADEAAKEAEAIAKEAEKIIEEQEKIFESLNSTKGGFASLRIEGIDSLSDLAREHGEKMKEMDTQSKELISSLGELKTAYSLQVAGFDKSAAEKVLDQEKLIAELQKQVEEKGAAGENTSELRSRLEREKGVLRNFLEENKDLEDELVEARRRANLTDFGRFVENIEAKRAEAEKEFENKKSQIENEITLLEDQRIKEEAIYNTKKDAIQKINDDIKNYWSHTLLAMENRTDYFAKQIEAKLEAVKATFAAIQSYSGAGTSAADERTAGNYLDHGPELFVPHGSGSIVPNNQLAGNQNINISIFENSQVEIRDEADEDRLVDKIKSALAREMELIKLGAI